eukprot:6266067-Pyramimonas_sp.AAC.1
MAIMKHCRIRYFAREIFEVSRPVMRRSSLKYFGRLGQETSGHMQRTPLPKQDRMSWPMYRLGHLVS